MASVNRARYAITRGGEWRTLGHPPVPDTVEPIGTITVAREIGVLVKVRRTGVYMMWAGGFLRPLVGSKVEAALFPTCSIEGNAN